MPTIRRARILVIDDEPPVRRVLRDVLVFLGYEANEAADAAEGLALFEREAYDLVLTDLRMPGMSGWDVVEALRRRAPATAVIITTGAATDRDADRAREQGLAMLPKPVQIRELEAAVRQALGRRAGEAPD